MDNDILKGKWTELKGRMRQQYGELSDDEIEEAKGDRERLEGLLQQRYGQTKDEARRNVDDMLAGV